VGDDPERLHAVLQRSLERVDLVIAVGGLGPTEDDITREAIARAISPFLTLVAPLLGGG